MLNVSNSADFYSLVKRGGTLFAIKSQPSCEQPVLVAFGSFDDLDGERLILDPMQLDPTGSTTIDFFVPSRDGSVVAVSLSRDGSEDGTLHLFKTATGEEIGDRIPRVTYPTSGGDVAWNADGTGFFYTKYPGEGERPAGEMGFYQQVYFHRLGTPVADDDYEIGREFPHIAETMLRPSPDYRYVLATVLNGTSTDCAHFLRDPTGAWKQITRFEDQVTQIEFGSDCDLYLLSRQDAPRGKILRLTRADPDLSRVQTIVCEGTNAIQSIVLTATRVYATVQTGGPSQIHVHGCDGEDLGILPTEPVSSIGQILHLCGDTILFRCTSFITPPTWYHYDPSDQAPGRTPLTVTSPADFSDAEVTRTFATSKDGTQVPLNIIHRKSIALDGSHPTILYAYGGLGISLTPAFNVRRRLWLDYGGVFVIANLRGGGEYGAEWHRAGKLTNRQKVFDDFAACAEHLIDAGYTRPSRLAIEGRSNGGILMGVALTQRPDLFRAVVAHVGTFDMLRAELHPNGECNVPEFGTVKVREQFEALHAYSPFHRVVAGTPYPATLLITGENDGRLDPANSRRMAARLQAATSSGRPVLLRTSAGVGHLVDTSLGEKIAEDTDIFTFLVSQLEIRSPVNPSV